MAEDTTIQTNFTSGEHTPLLGGQIDLEKYHNGVKELQNFIAQKHGGINYRSGTRHVAAQKNNTDSVILVEFEYSTTQTYILEFGNLYMRIYRDKAQLMENPTTPTEIVTPYLLADLRALKFAQSADVLYITHNSYAPRQLARTTAADTLPGTWSLTKYDYKDGPYLDLETKTDTMIVSANTGAGITITASAATFASTDVDRLIRIKYVANWGYAKIVGFTSDTIVTADVVNDFDAATPGVDTSTDWRLGAWSDTAGVGWPAVATFHQNSLIFANTPGQPQTLFKSVTNDYTNHQPSAINGVVGDDDGFTRTINDRQVNAIHWLESDNEGLMILTGGGVFIGRTSDNFDPITPTNFIARRHNRWAAHPTARPHAIGETVAYITASGEKVRELKFEILNNRFIATDLAIVSEHITSGGVKDTAYQQEPDSILWAVRNDGVLLGLTLERRENVIAWQRHPIAGVDAEVEAIASIRDGTDDLLWLSVKRTVNGQTVRTVEYMEVQFNDATEHEDGFFVDAGLTYSGALTDTITGLDHLEGETVGIMADGATHPEVVVSGGQITLDYEAAKVHVGLPYIGRVKSLPVVAKGIAGGGRGKLTRIGDIAFQFNRTLGGQFGFIDGNLKEFVWRKVSDPMDTKLDLKSLMIVEQFPQNADLLSTWTLEQAVPQPMNLLQVNTEISVGDRM